MKARATHDMAAAPIPSGYKRTEVGVLPDDWDITTLGELGQSLSGGTPRKSDPRYWDGNIPWVSSKDMKVSRIGDAIDHVTELAIGNGTRLVASGTILIVVRGMALAHSFPVAIVTHPLTFNQDLKAFVPHPRVCGEFLLRWLQANQAKILLLATEATHGTKRLPTGDLLGSRVSLPPIPEQRAIAAALSDVDALIEALDAAVAKKRAIKLATMQQLLTGKTRLPGFSGAWTPTTLGGLATFLSGGTPSRSNDEYWNGDIPWISATSLRCFEIYRSDSNVTEEAVAAGTKMAPVDSTLLLVRGSALHKEILCGLVTKPVCFNQDVKSTGSSVAGGSDILDNCNQRKS